MRRGPLFTRQATRGNRLDQARLDRIYLGDSAEWVEFVKYLDHDGRQSLSDHVPVVAWLQLHVPQQPLVKRGSYYKMDARLLLNPQVKQEIRSIWNALRPRYTDPRVFWEQAWKQIKAVLIQERDRLRAQQDQVHELQQRLLDIRSQLTLHSDPALIEDMTYLVNRLRKQEQGQAAEWRRRSCIKWLKEGDAPTRYFFAILKGKHQREAIRVLETADGTLIEDEEAILKEIQIFYTDLFQQDSVVEANLEERTAKLAHISARVSSDENVQLRRVPQMPELDAIV